MILGAREGASGDVAPVRDLKAAGSGRVSLSGSRRLIRVGPVAVEVEEFIGQGRRRQSRLSVVAAEVRLDTDEFSHDSIEAGHSGQRLNQLVHVNPVFIRSPKTGCPLAEFILIGRSVNYKRRPSLARESIRDRR
ncbi:hypothetical protein ACQR0Z_11040 [Bradyrhizobium sp. HKCCYLS3077]|uniref:hypothetical protein n=1 Tax=Bradyrhizobium sp. HKCCYLS3077 TaxID=3420761 RepID=UPI003EC109F9